MTSRKRKKWLRESPYTVRGEGSAAGEGRVVGLPKFHSWGKCTMPLTNINSDWMSNASSGLRVIYLYIYVDLLSYNLGFCFCFFERCYLYVIASLLSFHCSQYIPSVVYYV